MSYINTSNSAFSSMTGSHSAEHTGVNLAVLYDKFPPMKTSIAIQSGRPSSEISISPEAQQDVRQAFLVNMRQRFKTEINRLTKGDMLSMLTAKTNVPNEAENLSFLMTYVYAWNWLQQNTHTDFQAEVLAAFAKGPQAFLMNIMLQSRSTAEFIKFYIQYWQTYSGEPQLQQHQLLQLTQQHDNTA